MPVTGCASDSGETADSTCGAYLKAETAKRHAAATRLSVELHAYAEGSPIWGTGLDAACATASDATLRQYFAGQLALGMPAEAMAPTINVDDTVLVNTLAYRHGVPRRGEVVAFTAPENWRS